MNRHPAPISNFEFSPEDIKEAVRRGRLLSMEIEFSLRCNFRCPYCYVPREDQLKNELCLDEIRDTILQAKALGARKIIILGGEPTIYPHTLELIRFMRGHELEVEIFSNGSGITAEFARQLHAMQVRVVMKMNSFDAELQDRLSGLPGAHRIIHDALEHLKSAGYPSAEHFLAVSSIICPQNIDELPGMWQWLREQGIAPYFEIITPQANARHNDWLMVDPLELERFFQDIADMDRRLFGQEWEIQPPLVGNKCMRHKFSCLVNAQGYVMPCVGVTIPLGNIRQQPLTRILAESQVLKDLKDHRHTIKGPCHDCDRAEECYGCRGAAYQLTGDYLASDPLCWRNCRTQKLQCASAVPQKRSAV
ncbi:radical SAM protein [Desulfatitalea alkaliphila]|uniref:Radical SAM protein n=1 Tax=Desulfatitalea alkaliphila TaxID=2929485 RepID=A0AA41R268_9BACT|nr:radical SAM protein [Desulfatitalea alkaliphila]